MCPVCHFTVSQSCYLPDTLFQGKRFAYRHCRQCSTLFLDPMPSQEDIDKMYEYSSYHSVFYETGGDSKKEGTRSLGLLKEDVSQGKLLDVGCGVGNFMTEAAQAGFSVWGTELQDDLTTLLTQKGFSILSNEDLKNFRYHHFFDVIHMGDVLEHLPSPGIFLNEILSLLKPEGYLLLEGPLENNNTLSLTILKFYKYIQKKLRRNRACQHIPYHTIMMTYKGFKNFLSQYPIKIEKSIVFEHDWPLKIDFSKKKLVLLTKSIISLLSVKIGNSYVGKKMKWGNRVIVLSKKYI